MPHGTRRQANIQNGNLPSRILIAGELLFCSKTHTTLVYSLIVSVTRLIFYYARRSYIHLNKEWNWRLLTSQWRSLCETVFLLGKTTSVLPFSYLSFHRFQNSNNKLYAVFNSIYVISQCFLGKLTVLPVSIILIPTSQSNCYPRCPEHRWSKV